MKKFVKTFILIYFLLFVSGCSTDGLSTQETVKTTGSVWKSTNSGKNWAVKNKTADENKSSIADADILNIAINPYDSNDVLFGTRNSGIIRTKDGGETLETTNFISEKVYGLVFDPIDGRIFYASGAWQKRGKIFKTTDGGEKWTEIFTAASEGPLIISMAIDRNNPTVLYASVSDNQIIKSTDAGISWKNIFQAPAPVLQISVDRFDSNLVYFNVQGSGVYRSREGGANAISLYDKTSKVAAGNTEIKFITTDPSNAQWIYAVGGIGIVRSKNEGEDWEKVRALNDPQAFPVTSIAISPANSNEIIYGSAKAVYKSEDQGVNWATYQLADTKTVKILKYSLADPEIVYLGTSK